VVGWKLDYIQPNAEVTYNSVDFNKKKYKKITYRVASGSKGGTIHLYVGNQLIATTDIANTGSWKEWTLVETKINEKIKGVKNIKLVFKGDSKYLMNLDWLQFD